jgi:hypothetical protein
MNTAAQTTDRDRNIEIANIIREQLGRMALMMLGAKNLIAVDNGLRFDIRGSQAANKVEIILDPSDTYTVKFWKGRGTSWRVVAEQDGVYVDCLLKTITTHTGLYTSL